ncbi:abortive infection family protein [Sporosarcina sp. BP05]|uniref:abortive infection family protein n=1 Tax=Sporosarcina sp. BP05 TaxID=2758726 RepID=UPI001645568F|nr:abortive infection family protein [Sporosarcina sp. BP05]
MNKSVEYLESSKNKIRSTFDDYCEASYSKIQTQYNPNKYISDKEFQSIRLLIIKLSKEQEIEVPTEIDNARTVREFIEELTFDKRWEHEYVDNYLKNLFNKHCNYLEKNMYEVEIVKIDCELPKELHYINIVEDLNKCDKKLLEQDYRGAITSARTVVEGVMKEILTILGEDVSEANPNFPRLFNDLSKKLNMDASKKGLDNPLKEIISGLNKIINGLNELRNMSGDGHSKQLQPLFHHAVLAVNSAKTVTSFLFHTFEYQKEKGLILEKDLIKGGF